MVIGYPHLALVQFSYTFPAVLALALSALSATAVPTPAGDEGAHYLFLRQYVITTVCGGRVVAPTTRVADLRAVLSEREATRVHYFICQCGSAVDAAAVHAHLAPAAVLGYVPDNAFIVAAPAADVARIAALRGVVWVGDYTPGLVLDPRCATAAHADSPYARTNVLPVVIHTFSAADSESVEEAIHVAGGQVVNRTAASSGALLIANVSHAALPGIAHVSGVAWIEPYTEPELLNDVARGSHGINVHLLEARMGLDGDGELVGHADTGIDAGSHTELHPDLQGQLAQVFALGRDDDWSDPIGHGTHTAGTIAGTGAASRERRFRGIAPAARLVHQSIMDADGSINRVLFDLYALCAQAYQAGARVHSDSWGANVSGAYTWDAALVDRFMWEHPDMLLVFAAGNTGHDANRDGVVDPFGLSSPATAKNVLSVGAAETARAPDTGGFSDRTWDEVWLDSYPVPPLAGDLISSSANGVLRGLAAFSSRGPTADGRIKPDIVAPGTDIISCRSRHPAAGTGWGIFDSYYHYHGGSSMATPIAAGAAALARQYCRTQAGISNPSAALVKAILINGAMSLAPGQYGLDERQEISVGNRGNIDEGYGMLDLARALPAQAEATVRLSDDRTLRTGGTNTYRVPVRAGDEVRVTLAWTDYPAALIAARTLVNDLDLCFVPPGASPRVYARGSASPDRRNNVEVIDLVASTSGTAVFEVVGHRVPMGPQPYALAWTAAPALTPTLAFARVTHTPTVVAPAQTVVVDAWLEHRRNARLTVDLALDTGQGEVHHLPCTRAGGTTHLSLFTAALPGLPENTQATFTLCATDANGARVTSERHTFTVAAQVIHVVNSPRRAQLLPADSRVFTSIGEAVGEACDGTTVVVHDGVYREKTVHVNKALRLVSLNGPRAATIDGGRVQRCITLAHPGAVVQGFTLRHGHATGQLGASGGGAYLTPGAILRNCTIHDCRAERYGGGVYCDTGGVISNCTVRHNRATFGGGGVYCSYGGSVLDCRIERNRTHPLLGKGGGLMCVYGGVVRDALISHNRSRQEGGGVWLFGGAVLERCRVVKNTSGFKGGGVFADSGGLLQACTIEGNRARRQGGGVFAQGDEAGARARFSNCRIIANRAKNGGGVTQLDGVFTDCLIAGNRARRNGGGVEASGGLITHSILRLNRARAGGGAFATVRARLEQCTLARNKARAGGGAHVTFGAVLEHCALSTNTARTGGGSLCVNDGVLEACVIAGNTARNGAGVATPAPDHPDRLGLVNRCHIHHNTARRDGGGVALAHGAAVRNSIVEHNTARRDGGGVHMTSGGAVHNVLVLRNTTRRGTGGISIAPSGEVVNCVIYWNRGDTWNDISGTAELMQRVEYCCLPTPYSFNHNIHAPPAGFSSEGRPDADSPCVDMGRNLAWMASASDYNGRLRIVDGRADIGCYEYATFENDAPPKLALRDPPDGSVFSNDAARVTMSGRASDDHGIRRVTVNGARAHALNGESWRHTVTLRTGRNALKLIAQDSANQAATAKVVYTLLPAPVTPTVTNSSVYVSHDGSHAWPFDAWSTAATCLYQAVASAFDGCTIRVGSGTYACAGVTVSHAVLLEGAYGAGATRLRADGAQRCLTLDHSAAVVRGLTLSDGYGYFGGGVFSTRGGTLDSCVLALNTALGAGGGAYFAAGGLVTNCLVAHNTARTDGGGLVLRGDALVAASTVRNNAASGNGGGLYCATYARAHGTEITGNVASNFGGGTYADVFALVSACSVFDNQADTGGGVYAQESALVEYCTVERNHARHGAGIAGLACIVRNCLVTRNRARGRGAGIDLDSGELLACTIADNQAVRGVGGVALRHSGIIANTIVRRNASRLGKANLALRGSVALETSCLPRSAARPGTITRRARFIDPNRGNYRLQPESPCIDRGGVHLWMSVARDLDGRPRVQGDAPDIGAFEFAPANRGAAGEYRAGYVHLSHSHAASEPVPEPVCFAFPAGLLVLLRQRAVWPGSH